MKNSVACKIVQKIDIQKLQLQRAFESFRDLLKVIVFREVQQSFGPILNNVSLDS